MSKISKKGKLIVAVVAFFLFTPLTVFYVLDGSGVFDTRSRAGETEVLSEEFAKADLDGDKKVTILDFKIWLENFKAFKKNESTYSKASDFDSDGSVNLIDFGIWLNMWKGYKAYVANSTPHVNPPINPPVSDVIDNIGTGVDGDIVISANTNINTQNKISGRDCANGGDAVNFNVVSFSSEGKEANLSSTPSTGCLNIGDDVLVINLQGTVEGFANVGNYEILKVANVSASKVTFETAKVRFYGNTATDDSNIGIEGSNQKVMLQRIPNYRNVTVNASKNFSPSIWDGLKGGVIFFKASGDVKINGIVHANAVGYRGGAKGIGSNTGTQGESIKGVGIVDTIINEGAGGGGYKYVKNGDGGDGGGGGSYGTSGIIGKISGSGGTGGVQGNVYGVSNLSKLFFGSAGGGGGSYSSNGGAGGNGGGIVYISGNKVTVSGSINCNGSKGKDSNGSSGGGGGAAGGSIRIYGLSVDIGVSKTTVSGGIGGTTTGGKGGDGRIAVYYKDSIIGTTSPIYFSSQVQ